MKNLSIEWGTPVMSDIVQALRCEIRNKHALQFTALAIGIAAALAAYVMAGYSLPLSLDFHSLFLDAIVAGAIAVWIFSMMQTRFVAAMADKRLSVADSVFESQNCLIVTDAGNRIIKVNRAFTECTGYEPEEVIGKSPKILSSGQQDAAFYSAMWESINKTGGWQGEIWNRRKSGAVYPELLSISAVKGGNGEVTNYVASFTDISRLKSAEKNARTLRFYDPVTGLPNRRMLLSLLKKIIVSDEGRECALLIVDISDLKTLNDTLGHHVGDILLKQVAQRIHSALRDGDTLARLGGDEFVVILEDVGSHLADAREQVQIVGNKLLAELNRPFALGAHEYCGSASIGVAMFSGKQKVGELLKAADIALNHAKRAGRNTIHFFDPKMQEALNTRVSIINELSRAVEKRQFHLYYQVQVDGMSRPVGAEALIRWMHPERGIISPSLFIPLAEETGEIVAIGNWVLDEACARISSWQNSKQTQDLVLAVNVSAAQFRQPDFVEQVKAALHRHAINPRLLKLELTESMLLDNVCDTLNTIEALKETGISFSLDDFGTGYSSLQYLACLPLDQLKIDQSFVRNMDSNPSASAIIGTIIAMARDLNMGVIAEGVETEEQRQLLMGRGCLHFQGYLYSKPVPVEEFEVLVHDLHRRAYSCHGEFSEELLLESRGFSPDMLIVL